MSVYTPEQFPGTLMCIGFRAWDFGLNITLSCHYRTPSFNMGEMDRRTNSACRATSWRIRSCTLRFASRPLLMGIVNVTPDSFSDGGRHSDLRSAVEHGLRLADEGADLLDIGGESTRPYARPVHTDEELKRVVPVVTELCKKISIPVSIDTSKVEVARRALEAGAEIVNDVTGFRCRHMIKIARDFHAGVCVMHMQGTPQTMQDEPTYDDVVDDIYELLASRRDALNKAGIQRESICLDPGIGFGKTHAHNLGLLANSWRFCQLGCPILVGHSRKGFIGKTLGDKKADRTAGTIGTSLALARQGVHVLRVHDVKPIRDALLMFEVTGGLTGLDD